MRPLILTARLDGDTQSALNALREQYFPAERNWLAAHLTMFHALPGENLADISSWLSTAANRCGPMIGKLTGLRSLGKGVAITVNCPSLAALRAEMSAEWDHTLMPQDRQKWAPHITVQNKVSAAEAHLTLEALRRDFSPKEFRVEGLELWHYDGGPWEFAAFHPFAAGRSPLS